MFLQLQAGEGIDAAWVWLLFLAIPVIGRVIGWVMSKLSPGQSTSAPPKGGGPVARDERRRLARDLERQGQELWRRLLEGDKADAEPPAEPRASGPVEPTGVPEPRPASVRPVPEPRPAPEPSPVRRPSEPTGRAPEPFTELLPAGETSWEHERVAEPARVPHPSVGPGGEPAGVGQAPRFRALGTLHRRPGAPRPSPVSRGLALLPEEGVDLVRAIVWSEILGPPVSLRDLPGAR